MKFLFSGAGFHALLKTAPEHSSKQGKGSTFCTLLVGALPGPAGPLFAENDPLDHFPGAQSPNPFYQRKRCGCYANQRDSSS